MEVRSAITSYKRKHKYPWDKYLTKEGKNVIYFPFLFAGYLLVIKLFLELI